MKTIASDRNAGISSSKLWLALGAAVLAAGAAMVRPAAAQDAPPLELASADALAELVGPIALYPDDLIAIVLPAATYPLQVVQAERFIAERKRNANLEPEEDWDDSVVALLNYPEVVELLNDDLDWTYDLGTAVLNQRADVLDAIQTFRDRAYAAGNLRSDDRQTVTRQDDTIAIKPADPQVIYVPYYEPERVVIYQPARVYYYHPWAYPVYYYPYPAGYVFNTDFFWGVRSWFSIGWHTHHLHVYDYYYRDHPYFGWTYYDPFFVRNVYINVNVNRGYVWEPRNRYGGRPVVRGYEGRVYTATEPPRASRSVGESTYRSRTTEGPASTAPRSRAAASGEQNRVSQGVAGSAYRNRSIETTEQGRQSAATNQPTRGVDRAAGVTRDSGYRGRGMAQALEQNRAVAQPNRDLQTSSSNPRALSGSTGMPRESSRGTEMRSAPRESAPVARAPTHGVATSSERSGGGGSYRSGDGGGDRGGGSAERSQQQHPAARRGRE